MSQLHRAILVVVTLASAAPGVVAAQAADSTTDSARVAQRPLFTRRDALVAGAFVGGMALALRLDEPFARRLRDSSTQTIRIAKSAAEALNWLGTPGTMVIGGAMYVSGRWIFKNDDVADLGLHGTEAIAVGLTATMLLKNFVGRARPLTQAASNYDDPYDFNFARGWGKDAGDYRSFPSGHTTMGFAAAAAVTEESRRWWPEYTWIVAPLMYGGATLIGVARMYSDKHWGSDVVGGAAIGAFSGWKVVHYHHTHPDNRIDRLLLALSVGPDGRGGLAIAVDPRPLLQRDSARQHPQRERPRDAR